ncbi:MAG: hypothetical protein ACM3ZE_11495 [Myxococcales bacterium]
MKPTPSPLRKEPAFWVCVVLVSAALMSVTVGVGARVTYLGQWMGGICGEWAPPGWRNDPRCDGSLKTLEQRAYTTAKWCGGALPFACAWLVVRRKQRRPRRS